jgi:hypothetical protein
VANNTFSFDETVLAPGPWTKAAPQLKIKTMFPTLTQCMGAGTTMFHAIGAPSDDAMFSANRSHEDHHVADTQNAFNTTFVPWDQKLTAAQATGTAFTGPTQDAAQAALFAAMGGTPDQIANAFSSAVATASNAFHATPKGDMVFSVPNTATADAGCANSSAKFFNPATPTPPAKP